MHDYNGFLIIPSATGSGVTVHANTSIKDWAGEGFIGSMPNRAVAKLYVDWLSEIGYKAARTSRVEGAVPGHVVMVNGDRPDADAKPINVLMDVFQALSDDDISDEDLRRAFGDVVHAIDHLEIAADQAGEAWAYKNFVMHTAQDGRTALELANFQLVGEWNGYGQVATGIGQGWVPVIADYLLSRSLSDFDARFISSDEPLRHARYVFVEGSEPDVGPDAIAELKTVVHQLATINSRGRGFAPRHGWLVEAREHLERIIDGIVATDDPSPRP